MPRPCWHASRVLVLAAAGLLPNPAAAVSGEPEEAERLAVAATAQSGAAACAQRIDFHIEAAWREQSAVPAPLADDAEFLRRVYLDLAGKIPPVSTVRAFLQDESPGKRRRVVARLLSSPAFYSNFAAHWRSVLIPEAAVDFQLLVDSSTFDLWLRKTLVDHAGYDQLVHEILTHPIGTNADSGGARLFYASRDARAEELAAATSRLFLGLRLECAQCHDHPFSRWTQEAFWSQAAFFAGLERASNGQLSEDIRARTISIAGGDRLAVPRYLDGSDPGFDADSIPRQLLADWVTRRENPYFARAAVNRVWALLFGYGIVHPADDFDEANPPSHPELLDELASQFVQHDFDLRFLIAAITASRVYQLTSRETDSSQRDPRLFARHVVRALTADQLYDSLSQAAGYYDGTSFGARSRREDRQQNRLRELFAQQAESPSESEATILQALALMNGELMQIATDPERGATLGALLDASFLSDAECIRTLYLATLSREPRSEEIGRMVAFLSKTPSGQRHDRADNAAAFSDIFWMLLNSSEFGVNH